MRTRVEHGADASEELLLEAVQRHEAALRDGRAAVLKADHRARVTRSPSPDPRFAELCVKEFVRHRPFQRLVDLASGSRARAAWLGARACAEGGVDTPRALGAVERGPRSWFVSEYVPDACCVNEFVSNRAPALEQAGAPAWVAFVDGLADFVARLHTLPLRHHDLAPKNVLLQQSGDAFRFYLIDLSDIRLRPPSRAFKIRNLGQLAHVTVPPSEESQCRFFERYTAAHPDLAGADHVARIRAVARARRERWLARGGAEALERRRREGLPV